MSKRALREFEKNKNIYYELAEKRTIEALGMKPEEVTISKAFETTKAVELEFIKDEIQQKQNEKLTFWSVLFRT